MAPLDVPRKAENQEEEDYTYRPTRYINSHSLHANSLRLNLCIHRPTYVFWTSMSSVSSCRPNPLAGSTRVRGPTTDDFLSLYTVLSFASWLKSSQVKYSLLHGRLERLRRPQLTQPQLRPITWRGRPIIIWKKERLNIFFEHILSNQHLTSYKPSKE